MGHVPDPCVSDSYPAESNFYVMRKILSYVSLTDNTFDSYRENISSGFGELAENSVGLWEREDSTA